MGDRPPLGLPRAWDDRLAPVTSLPLAPAPGYLSTRLPGPSAAPPGGPGRDHGPGEPEGPGDTVLDPVPPGDWDRAFEWGFLSPPKEEEGEARGLDGERKK